MAEPCPFCGHDDVCTEADGLQGFKYGQARCANCGAAGPEVRTDYDMAEHAEWRREAIAEWNSRVRLPEE